MKRFIVNINKNGVYFSGTVIAPGQVIDLKSIKNARVMNLVKKHPEALKAKGVHVFDSIEELSSFVRNLTGKVKSTSLKSLKIAVRNIMKVPAKLHPEFQEDIAEKLETVEPEVEVTETVKPEVEVTETVKPEVEVTETVKPEVEVTETVKPEVEVTETVKPEVEVTETVKPEVEVTETVKPEVEVTETVVMVL